MSAELYEAIARGADLQADQLDSLAATLNTVGNAAKEKLGGTATGKDKEMVGLVGLARKETKAAVQAFRDTARLARSQAAKVRAEQEPQRQARSSGGRG